MRPETWRLVSDTIHVERVEPNLACHANSRLLGTCGSRLEGVDGNIFLPGSMVRTVFAIAANIWFFASRTSRSN
jgi:hypothetical protein